MLIEFAVKNFLSFRDDQKFSLVANSDSEHRDENCFKPPAVSAPDLLRVAMMYGPNASGKSNLIRALRVMKTIVTGSKKLSMADALVIPFLLDHKSRGEPSEFEIIFVEEGIKYQYGFVYGDGKVHHEWLFAFPHSRPQKWFERYFDAESNTHEFDWGDKFKGKRSIYKETTREDSLLLTNAAQLNNKQLRPIYDWFAKKLVILDLSNQISGGYTMNRLKNDKDKMKIIDFLNAADLSIQDISEKEIDFSVLPNSIHKAFLEEFEGPLKIPLLKHGSNSVEKSFHIPLHDDSQGTQKLFTLAGPILDVFESGIVLVVDELSNSLHPSILKFIMGLFQSPRRNLANAQLIFTSHNPSILDLRILRRDQVWFLEKDNDLASTLYPLTEFHPRNTEAIDKGYLNGRYGALPLIDEDLFDAK